MNKARFLREDKRRKCVKKYARKRAEYKTILKDQHASPEEKHVARVKLQSLPRDSNPNRITNRCSITGRCGGYIRDWGVSRIVFRRMAHRGLIPGVLKSSW